MDTIRPIRWNVLALLLAALLLVAPVGCSQPDASAEEEGQSEAAAQAEFPVTVTDDLGREVTIQVEPTRVVSLAPANTEIVYALGLLDRLVGVTSYDDYPVEVTELPQVGDFVGPNVEAVIALEPDLVLATGGVQADVLDQLEGAGATVLAVDPQDVDGVYAAITMVGAATGASDEASLLVEQMHADIQEITETVGELDPVTCFVEIAQEPLFTAGPGTLIDDLIALAGGENVVSEQGYVGYSVEQLLEDDPAVYMATLGSMSDPDQLAERPGYDELGAVAAGRIAILSDNLVSRPGPRIVEGVAEIARALHPDAFE